MTRCAVAKSAPASATGAGISHLLGYARVSTTDQDLAIQEAALQAAGCTIIRSEKKSGTSTEGRTELETLIAFARPGDVIVVTRIDRLARSIADLAAIVRTLDERGIALKATEQPIDTSTAAGRAFLQMLGVFAEFETAIRRERQLEGIAKAKANGVYRGRPASIDASEVRNLQAAGMGASAIARQLGIGRASVYRLLTAQASSVAAKTERLIADDVGHDAFVGSGNKKRQRRGRPHGALHESGLVGSSLSAKTVVAD